MSCGVPTVVSVVQWCPWFSCFLFLPGPESVVLFNDDFAKCIELVGTAGVGNVVLDATVETSVHVCAERNGIELREVCPVLDVVEVDADGLGGVHFRSDDMVLRCPMEVSVSIGLLENARELGPVTEDKGSRVHVEIGVKKAEDTGLEE